MEPFVSIVTPFYNTELYLEECIKSVLALAYKNWEYILVNNCSTDHSAEIAQSYVEKDKRIRLIHNRDFLTQVQNYNHALRQISSESKYCKIVQADDWIFPECLARMVEVAELYPSVGIVGAYRLDDVEVNCDGLPFGTQVFPGGQICRMVLMRRLFVFGTSTSMMFRSDIVRDRDPFYSESSPHEDTEACYEILQAHDFGFVHQVLTFTRRENESTTTNIRRFDFNYFMDHYIAIAKYGHCYLSESEFEKQFKEIELVYYRFLGEMFWSKDRKGLLEYHTTGLKNAGCAISYPRVIKFALYEFLKFVLNFVAVGKYMYRRCLKVARFFRTGFITVAERSSSTRDEKTRDTP